MHGVQLRDLTAESGCNLTSQFCILSYSHCAYCAYVFLAAPILKNECCDSVADSTHRPCITKLLSAPL